MQALQSGQITPAQYEMMMQKIQQMEINGVMTRGVDTPQERDRLQGLLGGGQQQMGQATVEPEWQPPKYEEPIRPNVPNPMMGQQIGNQSAYDTPMPQDRALQEMRIPPMPQANTGLPTPNERDFLNQFVDSVKSPIESRGVDTPQERDYIQDIMQNYNKGHNYLKGY